MASITPTGLPIPHTAKGRPRGLLVLALGAGSLLAQCSAAEGPGPATAEAGMAAYEKTCALCHGKGGEGYAADGATMLRNQSFLATASDEFLRRSIARGRPQTTMSAWSKSRGGPYEDLQIDGLVAYMRTWQTVPSKTLSGSAIQGDLQRGAATYAANCASCHGKTGLEGPSVRLANAEFLDIASDAFLEHAILEGRPGTPMMAYRGKLGDADVRDVVALLRSWAKPVAPGEVPLPGSLGPIVANPSGPEPAFTLGQRFTPADTIKKELDRGAAFGFLDARPPSDYATSHISGANNVPFYLGESYAFSLPKDRWLVSYCGCPHAESGALMDALVKKGFSKVTILDEGFGVWRDRGYPVRSGSAP
ncbi:MAG: c-type cytochrome [Polyangiaceae bacterium]